MSALSPVLSPALFPLWSYFLLVGRCFCLVSGIVSGLVPLLVGHHVCLVSGLVSGLVSLLVSGLVSLLVGRCVAILSILNRADLHG